MKGSYFDNLETITHVERKQYQSTKLRRMIKQGYKKSRKIKRIFDDLGLKPTDKNIMAVLKKLPVISREELIDMEIAEPPYGGMADADAAIERIFISPGPVYEPHLPETDPLWARAYFAAGFGPGDIVLNAFSYHMVAAGLTFHGGLKRVGATIVPSGTSGTDLQIQMIRDLHVTGYTGTPSFLSAIIRRAEELGHDFRRDFNIRRACFGAEPLPLSLREKFERDYDIDTYQMYGATEVGDIAYECQEKKGWHICEEVIIEILDRERGEEVSPGELGEVVVTRPNTIFFLFRFGTGDLSSLITEPCPCGRTSPRLTGIAGRVGDAVKVRGLFIAPSQLKIIGEKFPGIKYQLIIEREENRDTLTVKLDPGQTGWENGLLAAAYGKCFQEICTVRIDHTEVEKAGSISESEKPLVDKRTWK
jgi:phenylacetate-CoA ligase